MSRWYRVGVIGVLSGLFFCSPVSAQVGDTVRVGQESDTVAVNTAGTDTTQAITDSMAGEAGNKRANGSDTDHPEPLVLRRIPDSVVAAWQKDEAFAYANDPEYWRRKPVDNGPMPLERLFGSRGFEIFLLVLLGAVLLYAIIRIIMENNLALFYRSPRRKPVAAPAEEPNPIEDDLEGQLQHFLQTRNYRQAVRYLYLKSLRLLNDRGLIRYHQQSTNREYWQQLAATPQSEPFRDLTMAYEKVWYGEFPLRESSFERLHQYFEEFYKTVRV